MVQHHQPRKLASQEGNGRCRESSLAPAIDWVTIVVLQTLVLTYVTIPSARRMANASVSLDSPEILKEYSVRDVVIRRFIPARMRD